MWLPRHRNALGHPCDGWAGGGEASIFKILMSVPISLNEDSIPLDGARPYRMTQLITSEGPLFQTRPHSWVAGLGLHHKNPGDTIQPSQA